MDVYVGIFDRCVSKDRRTSERRYIKRNHSLTGSFTQNSPSGAYCANLSINS